MESKMADSLLFNLIQLSLKDDLNMRYYFYDLMFSIIEAAPNRQAR
jgi:hypothetical protein